jgi:hypothetical protein
MAALTEASQRATLCYRVAVATPVRKRQEPLLDRTGRFVATDPQHGSVAKKEDHMAAKRKSKLRWRAKKANHRKRPASG